MSLKGWHREPRICMISATSPLAGAGVERFVEALCSFLVNKRADVTVFCQSLKGFSETTKLGTLTGVADGGRFFPKYLYSVKTWPRVMDRSFDLVHGNGDTCFLYSIARRTDIPFLMTFHGTNIGRALAHRELSSAKKNFLRLIDSVPEFVAAKRSDVAVACSKSVENELKRYYGIDSAKIRVVYNGVDTDRFKPLPRRIARRLLNLPESRTLGIWVGNDPFLKGLDIATKAVGESRDVRLLVVGLHGKETEHVRYLGRMHPFDLRGMCLLYNSADFLIFPSRYEGFAIVPLEALSCGLPIILSPRVSTAEIMTNSNEGCIARTMDPRDYSDLIGRLLDSPQETQRMARNARALALKFDWKNQLKQYLDVYEELGVRLRDDAEKQL